MRTRERTAPETPRVSSYSYLHSDPITILVVDDDVIQREFSTVYLSEPAVSVVTAESAEAGLARLATERFAAALVDVEMPGMDGIELVRRLRTDPRHDRMPIMVITGLEDMASIDRAYAAGATSFMCKPVNWRLLSYQLRFMIRAHGALNRSEGGSDGSG